jgi:hypothetical protein
MWARPSSTNDGQFEQLAREVVVVVESGTDANPTLRREPGWVGVLCAFCLCSPDHGVRVTTPPRVASARVGSGAGLRVLAVASLEGQLGIPVMWVTWWLPTSRAPTWPQARGRKLLHSVHARRAPAQWHRHRYPRFTSAGGFGIKLTRGTFTFF